MTENQARTFEIVSAIERVETIASGTGVKVRARLQKVYGRGRWRKRKGVATVRLPNGKLRRVELRWYEADGIGPARREDQGVSGRVMKRIARQFALCLDNEGYEASLIPGKVYRMVPDARAAKDDLIRVIDESGEDYLFARSQFALVDFPQNIRRKILALEPAS